VIDCSIGQRKHDLAEEYLAKTTVTRGVSHPDCARMPARELRGMEGIWASPIGPLGYVLHLSGRRSQMKEHF
jgi:hypothetical protein